MKPLPLVPAGCRWTGSSSHCHESPCPCQWNGGRVGRFTSRPSVPQATVEPRCCGHSDTLEHSRSRACLSFFNFLFLIHKTVFTLTGYYSFQLHVCSRIRFCQPQVQKIEEELSPQPPPGILEGYGEASLVIPLAYRPGGDTPISCTSHTSFLAGPQSGSGIWEKR